MGWSLLFVFSSPVLRHTTSPRLVLYNPSHIMSPPKCIILRDWAKNPTTGRFVCRGPGIVVAVVDRHGGQRGVAATYELDLRLSESAVHDRL